MRRKRKERAKRGQRRAFTTSRRLHMRLLSGLGTPSCEPCRAALRSLARSPLFQLSISRSLLSRRARAHAYFLCLHSSFPCTAIASSLRAFPSFFLRISRLDDRASCRYLVFAGTTFAPRSDHHRHPLFLARARPRDDAALSIPVPAYARSSYREKGHRTRAFIRWSSQNYRFY